MGYFYSSKDGFPAQGASSPAGSGFSPAGALASAWADYLATFNWVSFVTLTFGTENHDVTKEGAWARFRSLWQRMNSDLYGNHYTRIVGHGYCGYALSFERTTKGVWHMHVLFDDRINYNLVHRTWQHIAGWAWIEPANSDAPRYLCKYISKGGEVKLYLPRERKLPSFRPLWFSEGRKPSSGIT